MKTALYSMMLIACLAVAPVAFAQQRLAFSTIP